MRRRYTVPVLAARAISPRRQNRTYRTLFLSDIHLGSRGCQAAAVVDFLRCHEAETIYLVGDIVDGWQLQQQWHWPQSHNDVVQKLLRQARKNTRVVYIPGNHDEFLREFYGTHFGGVEVAESAVHVAADGRKYLVVHGDFFDVVVSNARWLALAGGQAYDAGVVLSRTLNKMRRCFGLRPWSLSQWIKANVKNATSYIGEFEQTLATEAKRQGLDGVICGHIHHAVMHDRFGVRYINCGDWVESCTAVAENADGSIEIIVWTAAEESDEPEPKIPAWEAV